VSEGKLYGIHAARHAYEEVSAFRNVVDTMVKWISESSMSESALRTAAFMAADIVRSSKQAKKGASHAPR
jgi:hypothetical protein